MKPITQDMEAPVQALRWSFGDVVLDEQRLELLRGGERVPIERKPLDVLMHLLRHAGEVVTKDELAEQLWTRRVIDDAVVTKAVGKLREALGDAQQQLIKTVHGYGYRLVAPVRVEALSSPAPLLQQPLKTGDHPPQRPLWTLVEKLGAGGYGEVWLGRHDKTREARVFKFAADGPSLTALKREITLFRLMHDSLGARPDLVRLIDWNLEEPPYFVEAEYVPDGSLLQWAAAQGGLAAIPRAVRLEIAAQVADTLSAVHALGVLHKDLKPANVFAGRRPDGGPQACLADFGSGRLVDDAQLRALGITRLGFTQAIPVDTTTSGTPLYLAPEVLAGQLPSTRADLYALGVMLYQLAVADFARPLAPGWERDVDDELLREDIARCVDGDPQRRLADAGELARRLRALDRRRAESDARRTQAEAALAAESRLALLRRRRTLFLVSSLLLAVGLASTLVFYARAREQAARAADQAAIARAVNAFVQQDLLAAANPERTGRADIPVREVVDRAAAWVGPRFRDRPLLEGSVRATLGQAYLGLARYEQAQQELQRALELLRGPGDATQVAAVRLALASTLMERGAYQPARTQLQAVADDPDTPAAQRLAGRLQDIELRHREHGFARVVEELDSLRRDVILAAGSDGELALRLSHLRAAALIDASRRREAVNELGESLPRFRKRYGNSHPATLEARILLAELGEVSGAGFAASFADAQANHADALAVLGPSHALRLRAAVELAQGLRSNGQVDAAEQLLRDALAHQLSAFGEQHERTGYILDQLANVVALQGRHAESQQLHERAVPIVAATLGERHWLTLQTRTNAAAHLIDLERAAEAERQLRELRQRAGGLLGAGHDQLGSIDFALARALAAQGRKDEARALAQDALANFEKSMGPGHRRSRRTREFIAGLDAGSIPRPPASRP